MVISRTDILVRVVSVVLVIVLTTTLSTTWLFAVALVLGQGHVVLAYLYQIEGKHMSIHRLVVIIALFAAICWLGFRTPYGLFTSLVGIGFMMHFVMDETRLLGGRHSIFTTLEAAPLILLYSAIIFDAFFATHLVWYALAFSALILIGYGVLALYKRRTPTPLSYVFFSYFVLGLVLYAFASVFAPGHGFQWFIGIGSLHYFIWYGFYWFKLRGRAKARGTYVTRALLVSAVLAVAVVAYLAGPVPILAVLFSPVMFDVWVTMHGASTLRLAEYKAALTFPA